MDGSAPIIESLLLPSDEQELGRRLIEQFYQQSVERYGVDSEQAQMLSQLRVAYRNGSGS